MPDCQNIVLSHFIITSLFTSALLLRPLAAAKYCNHFVCMSVTLQCTHYIMYIIRVRPITSRRQVAGSPPNLYTMDSRSACIHDSLCSRSRSKVT